MPGNIFAAQQILAEFAKKPTEKLGSIFCRYDVKASVGAAGGLLTIPELQANSVRLEVIAHLIAASAAGKKKPNQRDAARWFKQVGQVFSHMEDPAEDVFVTRVHLEGQNYLVLEGLAEANGHHLQHMLTAVENMPDSGIYSALRQSCRAMLILSNLICTRSELEAFCCGRECGLDALPVNNLPTLKTLAERVTFSNKNLVDLKLNRHVIGRFCLPPK